MEVAELWRYPVKSMAGERISDAEVGERGIPGDRRLAAFELAPNPRDHELSARDVPGLLRFGASLGSGSARVSGPEVSSVAWDDTELRRSLSLVCRRQLEVRPMPQGAFDDSPILLVYMATMTALSEELSAYVDPRRFRANIYLTGSGTSGHAEAELVGRELHCGDSLVLQVVKVCARCSVTTRDPDTWANWPRLLRHLVQAHDEVVGVYCRVKVPGAIAEGERIEVV
ncbi:MAG TPA: MOSC domain-containing protein [Candidatus Dormibacteraeota bacterium]|nr:MOSC domain-containing protein [Candidatus Dormibacteraeota bacterium]